ncbi:DUF3288 family protein [Candidatus Gracilibacteria bacterium]|jgi:Protein of unknown function (DUF3288)|nr:DUF3288 family protein [Candidatus Gracilibacteria bacterium]NJM87844.1 DUF3288 family protein [Hydrococcus sp. RU_2_2]NJP20224.1 DUF3288 family protein [Hydrococcus sp. CRU_1_1]NJQ98956.1 DUF3288 family protein [Hydrococcus sp. CSU_1_8]
MSSSANAQDQQHPLEKQDREIVERLLRENLNDKNSAELARLRIRYRNFPGARDIQQSLDVILKQWNLTEEELFEKTRQLHAKGQVYQRDRTEDKQDWS